MAYTSGAQSSPGFTRAELIGFMQVFLAANSADGWSIVESRGSNATYLDRCVIRKTSLDANSPDVYISIWDKEVSLQTPTDIAFNLSTGYTAVNPWYTQPGARFGTYTSISITEDYMCHTNFCTDDILEYHMFEWLENFWCSFRTSQGIWRSFSFGHITRKMDFIGAGYVCSSACIHPTSTSWDLASGGYHTLFFDQYISSSYYTHTSQVRVDTPSAQLAYALGCAYYITFTGTATQKSYVYGANDMFASSGGLFDESADRYRGFENPKMKRSPTQFSLTSLMVPINIYQSRLDDKISLIGYLPNIVGINNKNFTDGQEITVQTETWKVFPSVRKTDLEDTADGVPNSWYYGVAIRKTV